MPARINKIRHDENTLAKIRAGNIITRLMRFIEGEITLVPAQVTAALGLLKKIIPDVSSVEISGEITTTKVIRSPRVAENTATWAEQHGLNGQAKH